MKRTSTRNCPWIHLDNNCTDPASVKGECKNKEARDLNDAQTKRDLVRSFRVMGMAVPGDLKDFE